MAEALRSTPAPLAVLGLGGNSLGENVGTELIGALQVTRAPLRRLTRPGMAIYRRPCRTKWSKLAERRSVETDPRRWATWCGWRWRRESSTRYMAPRQAHGREGKPARPLIATLPGRPFRANQKSTIGAATETFSIERDDVQNWTTVDASKASRTFAHAVGESRGTMPRGRRA